MRPVHREEAALSDRPYIQDTISFDLKAEHVIINNTVKLIATVVALVAGDTTQETLRSDIRATMKKFVDTEWQFSNMSREADPSGWERVKLTATARVAETESYSLVERKDAVSRKGLTITDIFADTSVPFSMLEEAESALRLVLLQKAHDECKKLSEVVEPYRVHDVQYTERGISANNTRMSSAASSASGKMAYGTGFSDEDSLGNASKLTMLAHVRLARIHA